MDKKLISGLLTGILALGSLFAADDQVIMTVNGKDVLLSEFEYIWHKNSNATLDSTQSVEEYADLFTVFKLKVAAAEAEGLDTLASFKSELAGYRQQMVPAYLTDKAAEQAVRDEAYRMMQMNLELSHILILVKPDAAPADTLAAYNKLMDVRRQALKKGGDFAKLAGQYSEDGSKEQGGYLGINMASRYIYPFAKAACRLQEGEISMPVRTQFGYHLIKLHRVCPLPGQYESGHIFKAAPKGRPQAEIDEAEKEIRAAYTLLQTGATFEQVADMPDNNDDRYVIGKGGRYQQLRGGSLPYEYESTVLALQDGQYSEPFRSDYGWHIVKRYSVSEFPSQQALANELAQTVSRDERALAGQTALAEQLKADYGWSESAEAFAAFEQIACQHGVLDGNLVDLVSEVAPLASYCAGQVSAQDFARFLTDGRFSPYTLKKAWAEFSRQQLLGYEDSQLEAKYPEFAHLMQEYHDGILLFDISSREVWDRSSTDIEGLEAFFQAHKADYPWEQPHYKGFVISCSDPKVAKEAKKMIKKLEPDSVAHKLRSTFNNDSITYIKVDRGLYAKGDKPMIDKLAFKEGDWSAADSDFPYVFLQGKVLKAPEQAADCRGKVMADYQDYLEKAWVESLRTRFPVTINQEVLKQAK